MESPVDTCCTSRIVYTYISMTRYKSLISILSTYKYVTLFYAISFFSIEKYFRKLKEHGTSQYVTLSFFIEKIILKKQENHLMSPFSIEN
jgi:hypothetical protein